MTAIKLAICFLIALAIGRHSEWWAVVFLAAVLIVHLLRPVIRWIFIGWALGEGLKLGILPRLQRPRRTRVDPDDDEETGR
jgi:hypothetical protein